MQKTKWIGLMLLLCLFFSSSVSVYGTVYRSYVPTAKIKDEEGCRNMQGMAVGERLLYSAKINQGDSKAVINKTSTVTGRTVTMRNAANSKKYCSYLKHANDMDVVSINGTTYLFVTTLTENSMSLVKLRVKGNYYRKVGNYSLRYYSLPMNASGVKVVSKNSKRIQLLFKSGSAFYTGELANSATRGTIKIKDAFRIAPRSTVFYDDRKYVPQGFGYDNGTIYLIYTKKNTSVIYTFDDVFRSGRIISPTSIRFQVTSKTYKNLFEIESCGIARGRLYFNYNGKKHAGDYHSDGIGYFKGYKR